MKVLVLIDSISGGGAARVLTNLCEHWQSQGHEIVFVTLSEKETDFYTLSPQIKRIALDLHNKSVNKIAGVFANFSRIVKVKKVLKTTRPDVAIGFLDTANSLLALARGAHRNCNYIGSVHNYPPQNKIARHWHIIRKYCYKRLDSVIALTEMTKNWLLTYTNAKCVHVIQNPSQWPLITVEPNISPESHIAANKKTIISVGSLRDIKGFDLLLTAFACFCESNENWQLVILGEGPKRQSLSEQAEKLGISEQICMPGQVGNVADWYASSDMFVLSSRSEGFPGVLVEAMSSGLAAVSFDCNTGPRDIISHEQDGLLVPAEDVNSLTESMLRVANEQSLRARLGQNAVAISNKLSIDKISKQWINVMLGLAPEVESGD